MYLFNLYLNRNIINIFINNNNLTFFLCEWCLPRQKSSVRCFGSVGCFSLIVSSLLVVVVFTNNCIASHSKSRQVLVDKNCSILCASSNILDKVVVLYPLVCLLSCRYSGAHRGSVLLGHRALVGSDLHSVPQSGSLQSGQPSWESAGGPAGRLPLLAGGHRWLEGGANRAHSLLQERRLVLKCAEDLVLMCVH